VIDSEAAIAWAASFEPFKGELPKDAGKWLVFGHANDDPAAKTIADRWYRTDARDAELQRLWPDQFVRDAYVKGAHLDMAFSAQLGAALSVDPAHVPVVAARYRAGEAQPVLGHRALHLFVPVGFTWADVADLRRNKALVEYRAVLRDVEATALDQTVSLEGLDAAIAMAYLDRVAQAEARRPSRWVRLAVDALGLLVGAAGGLAAVGTPIVGGLVGAAAAHAGGEVAERLTHPRWLAVHHRLRRPPTTPGPG
jgi:hypothetical protein